MAHVAEGAAAGADVAQDHEGGGAPAEAFADVGAGGLFAHGVQLLFPQQLLDLAEAAGVVAGLDANPAGLFQRLFDRHDLDGNPGGLQFAFLLDAAFAAH